MEMATTFQFVDKLDLLLMTLVQILDVLNFLSFNQSRSILVLRNVCNQMT